MRWLLSAALMMPTTVLAQQACEDNTVRYGQHRETDFASIQLPPGGGIGQFYERPGPMDLVGMEIYAYGDNANTCNTRGSCVDQGNLSAFDLRAEVFLADSDGLPTGSAVVSRDITLPCRCDPTELDNIRERFSFGPIALTGDYVVTVINTDSSDNIVVRTNDFTSADGAGEDLGRHFTFPFGEAQREWFPASDIEVSTSNGRVDADADVYLHPIIDFTLDPAFEIEGARGDSCIQAGIETSFFATDPIAASPVYNTDERGGFFSSAWQFGDGGVGNGSPVAHTYAATSAQTVRHTVTFVGDTATCSTLVNQQVEPMVTHFFDCDRDGFTGELGDVYCGIAVPRGGECQGAQIPLLELQAEGDCNDNAGAIFPGAAELCDSIDNDCDESTDEDLDRPVTAPFGECSTDLEFCDDGAWLVDPNNVGPSQELCDGRDNDCNNTVDDGIADIPTLNQVGACAGNVQTCLDGGFADDTGNYVPSEEVCDGIDNDCDALTEDGVDEPQLDVACDGEDADECDGGVFTCDGGALVCTDGPEEENCDPDTEPDTEPDTDPDTDSDIDSDSNPDPDSDVDTDTTGPGPGAATRCGCASGPTGTSFFGLGLLLVGLVARRRS